MDNLNIEDSFFGDASLFEEISEDEILQGGWSWSWCCSTNTFSASNYLGNRGGWCTLTDECQNIC